MTLNKKIAAAFLVTTLMASSLLWGAQTKNFSEEYNLANQTPAVTLVPNIGVAAGSGQLGEFACVVTQAPSGHQNSSFGFAIKINGGVANTFWIYNRTNTFAKSALPFSHGADRGMARGDWVKMNLSLDFITLEVTPVFEGPGAASGKLQCSVFAKW